MSRRCENTPGAVKKSRLDPAAAFLDANVSNVATEDVGSSCDCLQLASSAWQVRILRLQGSVFRGPEPGWSWRQAGWENRISLPTVCRPVMWPLRHVLPELVAVLSTTLRTNCGVWPHLFFYLSWLRELDTHTLPLSLSTSLSIHTEGNEADRPSSPPTGIT